MRLYDNGTNQMTVQETIDSIMGAKTNPLTPNFVYGLTTTVSDILKDIPVNQATNYCVNDVIATKNYWDKFVRKNFEITKVIWNDNAVIVFWSDKTKTVVKRMETDEDDIYAAVAQALAKKIYGGTGSFHSHVDSVFKDYRTPMNDSTKNAIINSFSKFFNGIWLASHPNGTDRYSGPEE